MLDWLVNIIMDDMKMSTNKRCIRMIYDTLVIFEIGVLAVIINTQIRGEFSIERFHFLVGVAVVDMAILVMWTVVRLIVSNNK